MSNRALYTAELRSADTATALTLGLVTTTTTLRLAALAI